MIPTKAKPMRKSSKLEKKLQRAADGGIAVWTLKLNGLSRQPEMKRVGVVGNRTRYQSGVYVST